MTMKMQLAMIMYVYRKMEKYLIDFFFGASSKRNLLQYNLICLYEKLNENKKYYNNYEQLWINNWQECNYYVLSKDLFGTKALKHPIFSQWFNSIQT